MNRITLWVFLSFLALPFFAVSTPSSIAAAVLDDDDDAVAESIRFQRLQEEAALRREAEQERREQAAAAEANAHRKEQREAMRRRQEERDAERRAEEERRLEDERDAARERAEQDRITRQKRLNQAEQRRQAEERQRQAIERFNREAAQRREEKARRDAMAKRHQDAMRRQEEAEIRRRQQMQRENAPNNSQPRPNTPTVQDLLAPATAFLNEMPRNSAVFRITQDLAAAQGAYSDAQRIQATEKALREMQFFVQWSEQQLDGTMKTMAEGERLRRENGGLNPGQQQFMNELQRRRIQLLAERGAAIKILQQRLPGIIGQ